ncbi:MAG: hypothetical protein AAGH79_10845 [Bacteroidota bacterium]
MLQALYKITLLVVLLSFCGSCNRIGQGTKMVSKLSKTRIQQVLRSSTHVLKRYSKIEQLTYQSVIQFKNKMPIQSFSGTLDNFTYTSAEFKLLAASMENDLYRALYLVLAEINKGKVYRYNLPEQINTVLVLNAGRFENSVNYFRESGELVISSSEYVTRFNVDQILTDVTKLSVTGAGTKYLLRGD